MFGLAFLLSLSASSTVAPAPQAQHGRFETVTRLRAPLRCDDGKSPYQKDGSPNWECEIRDCSPFEALCWIGAHDECYDENGDDNGACGGEEVKTCKGWASCFGLWARCDGEYECKVSSRFGPCNEGICTLRAAPTSTGRSSPPAADRARSGRVDRGGPRPRSFTTVRRTGNVGG